MIKRILWLSNKMQIFGNIWLVAYIYPVWWTQDTEDEHGGYDMLTYRSTGRSYFKGTHYQRDRMFIKKEVKK